MKKAQFLFHVTSEEWGEEKILLPRDDGDNRDMSEDPIDRVCVSPTLSQCLSAIPYSNYKEYNIYRTEKEVRAYYANKSVFDRKITREKWLLEETKFIWVGSIPDYIMLDLPKQPHPTQSVKKVKNVRDKIKKILLNTKFSKLVRV